MGYKWLNCIAKQCILSITTLTAIIYVSCESEDINNHSFVSVPFLRRQDRLERDLGFVRGGANLTLVIRDLAVALPTSTLTLVFGPRIDTRFLQQMIVFLHNENITTESYSIATNETRDQYCNHIKIVQEQNKGLISVIFSSRTSSFELLSLIRSQNLIQRNILYFFYWELWHPSGSWKLDGILEAMRVAVLTNPRPGTYRIYYSQAGDQVGTMNLVNWWTSPTGLFRTPALPPPSKVYKDLHHRVLRIPVQHVDYLPKNVYTRLIWWYRYMNGNREKWYKGEALQQDNTLMGEDLMGLSSKPPWTFLSNKPGQTLVVGGRDHELLRVLSDKLRFRVKYFNPTNFSEIISDNKTRAKSFTGTLDLVSERLADLALGDVTVTFERNQAVEFSFPTLADSGAFVTHSPSPLNEALALVRPFQWQVWPVLVFTILLSGPILFAVMETPLLWERNFHLEKSPQNLKTSVEPHTNKHKLFISLGVVKRKVSPEVTQSVQPPKVNQFQSLKSIPTLSSNSLRSKKSPSQVFWQCVWFNLALFLKQNDRIPTDSVKVRLMTILTSFAATYVIGDMYSANLTSLLARPGRERPITNLNELEDAMRTRGYQLLVEKHSSSYAILENDNETIYSNLWFLARRQRTPPIVESGEIGMLRVRDMKNLAMLGGRETLYFDTLRFGAYNFQLSQKLYSRYSAIALQVGCPYIQNVNNILMQLFEAGILTKMTEAEYKKLGDKQYNERSKHIPATSTTPNFTPTESTTTMDCEQWHGEYDNDGDSNPSYDCDDGKDCTTESKTENDYGVYQDYGGYPDYYPDRYPDYGENQTEETDPPVSDSTVTPTPTPLTPAGGPLSGGRVGPLESPDEEGNLKARTASAEVILNPISIRMLQGAFYVLLLGYGIAGLALLLEIACIRMGRSQCNSRCRIDMTSSTKMWRVAYRRLVVLLANGVFVRSAKSEIIIDDRPESSASRTATRFSRISWKADESVDSEMNLIPFYE